MKVLVSDVKKWVGREERFQLEERWPSDAQSKIDYPLVDPARVDVLVRNVGANRYVVTISGVLQADAICSRCAEPFRLTLPYEATEEFRDEPGDNDENLDFSRFTGDKIWLDDMVAQAAALSVPIAVVCQENCRGLCPQCGTNWNLATCSCQHPSDDRWAALQVLVDSDQSEEVEREKHGRSKA